MRRILFVCMGNICRSPLAEGIARARSTALGLELAFDSAGTHAYHVGEPPDPRARALARRRGTPIDDLRARQVDPADFGRFDLILAADRGNLAALRRLQPRDARAELRLILGEADGAAPIDLPDPYYGDARDFEQVYDLIERRIDALLREAAGA
jgi:protein-tyrosine phosphatase